MDSDQGDRRTSEQEMKVQKESVRKGLIAPSEVLSTLFCGIRVARLGL
jgi:hypothetical protein